MLDASNAPFLIIGDAPHSILANLSNSDAVTYLTDRGQRGFNALWIELLCDSYTFGYGDEGTPDYGRDVNGNNPFTATLAGGYLRSDHAERGVLVACRFHRATSRSAWVAMPVHPARPRWLDTDFSGERNYCCQQYGQFLGNRYKNYPNIIWNFGNDFSAMAQLRINDRCYSRQ